jgi:hypothetical protein
MAGQPFGTSAGRPEGVAYREVRHEHRAPFRRERNGTPEGRPSGARHGGRASTQLSGRAADLFTSSQDCVQRKPSPCSAIATARKMARPLFMVSSHSRRGTES